MSIISILGACMMAISFVAIVNVESTQERTNPKPLTDEECKSLINQWVFCFSMGVLAFIIGLL